MMEPCSKPAQAPLDLVCGAPHAKHGAGGRRQAPEVPAGTELMQPAAEVPSELAADGIRLRDRAPPAWWSWLFAATIAFGGVYLFISVVMQERWGARAAYQSAADEEAGHRAADLGVLTPDRATLERVRTSRRLRDLGRGVFAVNCANCHGPSGEGGLIAPNLTDDFYLHVRTLEDVYDVIANGRKNGAMPAWRHRLTPNDAVLVAGYVAALKGVNAPAGKSAEGHRVGGF